MNRPPILSAISFLRSVSSRRVDFSLFEAIGNDASAGNSSELPFKLGSDQGWLSITGTNGVEIDEVHYLCHRLDVSQGRVTDGAATYADFELPTPGFSNSTDLSNEAAIIAGLRITELMYHPEDGDLEYIELRNVGGVAFDLAGVEFTDGIEFAFPQMTLQPGEFVLVVEDFGAFVAEYGEALNVAGSYSGKLSNGGEQLRLEIVSLATGVLDFEYDDGWYPSTDGDGFALEIVDDSIPAADYGERSSWRAGVVSGGSPGSTSGNPDAYDNWVTVEFGAASSGVTGKLDDPDRDGISNLLEFVLGGDPEVSDRRDLLQFSTEGDFLTMTYKRSIASVGVVDITPQISGDNLNWNSGGGLTVQELVSSDGAFETWRVRDAISIRVGTRRFLRIQANSEDGESAYGNWVVAEFGGASSVTGELDDPDRDGIANVLEFVLGGDPEMADRGDLLQFSTDSGFLTLTYRRAISSVGEFDIVPEVSGDGLNWNSGSGLTVAELISSDGLFETWSVRDATPISAGQRRFLRIRVTSE